MPCPLHTPLVVYLVKSTNPLTPSFPFFFFIIIVLISPSQAQLVTGKNADGLITLKLVLKEKDMWM
jgi:hypothetical protein